MDDAEVIAAIAAGELHGLATALDRYAASLFEYCHSMAPEAAADAVRDTFIIAWSRLDGLRDPDRLYPWLQAVAGNECFRRQLAIGPAETDAVLPDAVLPDAVLPDAALPAGLPGQVLSACSDNTPAGRAYRISVTHRAGPFGRDGFPKASVAPRTWRRRPRMRPRAGAAIAVLVVLAAAATTIVATLPASNARHGQASGARLGGPASVSSSASGAGLPTTPAQPIPSSSAASPPAMATASAVAGVKHAGAAPPPVIPMATLMPSAPPAPPVAPPPAAGVLAVDQARLNFVSVRGNTSVRTFTLTAMNGPVAAFTIAVPAGLPGSLTVSPSSGSLAGGASVTITVTAAATVPFVTTLTLRPGGGAIAVVVKVNPGGGGDQARRTARSARSS